MAGNLNKVFLMGNLTRDVELKKTPSNMSVANVGLAVNRQYRANDETREETTFVDCEVSRTAGVMGQYCARAARSSSRAAWRTTSGRIATQRRSKWSSSRTSNSSTAAAVEAACQTSAAPQSVPEDEIPF